MIVVTKNGEGQIVIALADVSPNEANELRKGLEKGWEARAVLTVDEKGVRIMVGEGDQLGEDETPSRYKLWIDGWIEGRAYADESDTRSGGIDR